MRFVTKPHDSPEMRGYPSYCVWDTELDEMASEKGLLLVFSSLTGEIACADANKKTQELNARAMRLPVYDMTPVFPPVLKRLLTLWDKHEEKYWGDGTAIEKWNDITERVKTWVNEEGGELEFLGDFKEEGVMTYSWAIKDNLGRLGRLEVTDKIIGEGWDVFFKFEEVV